MVCSVNAYRTYCFVGSVSDSLLLDHTVPLRTGCLVRFRTIRTEYLSPPDKLAPCNITANAFLVVNILSANTFHFSAFFFAVVNAISAACALECRTTRRSCIAVDFDEVSVGSIPSVVCRSSWRTPCDSMCELRYIEKQSQRTHLGKTNSDGVSASFANPLRLCQLKPTLFYFRGVCFFVSLVFYLAFCDVGVKVVL